MGHFSNQFKRTISIVTLAMLFVHEGSALECEEKIDVLSLDVISYEDFVQEAEDALSTLQRALHEKGIVGIRGVPGYKEKVLKFIQTAKEFSALPEEIKESYAPNRSLGEMFLGYEKGKERFKRPDGRWVIDDLKVSYYAFVPDNSLNKWPLEVDLKTSFQDLGILMSDVGKSVMQKIGLLEPDTGITLEGIPQVGRMLYYRKSVEGAAENPFWCGSHFDHGMFTTLLPAFYFVDGEAVAEPIEAGLFVKTTKDGRFKKVVANDPDIMLFQVGEFGQLVTNDAIRATEHRVHKALGCVERYTMALFFSAPNKTIIHSFSELTKDARYGGVPGEACSYRKWEEESFNRYLVKD
jgi:isopenicillin N synthase-like dioxygenase